MEAPEAEGEVEEESAYLTHSEEEEQSASVALSATGTFLGSTFNVRLQNAFQKLLHHRLPRPLMKTPTL